MSRFAWMTLVVVGSMWLGLVVWSDTARAQDVRTWSDASGKFKIKGTFKGEKDGVVTIEQEDGEEIEIETKKLSASDQRLVLVLKKEVTDNPFKKKDEDPFKAKGKSGGTTGKGKKTPAKTKEPEPEEPPVEVPDVTKAIAIRWDTSRLVTPGLSDEWKVEVPEREEEEPTKLKNVVLPPKTDFFDGLTGMAVDRSGRRGVVTYKTGGPGAKPATRVVLCNLETGKAGTPATTEGEYVPLALHDDGQRIVVQARERGFGNSGRMEVWSLQGSRVAKHLECNPFVDAKGSARDLAWARFVDENRLAICGEGGRTGILDFPDLTLQCYVDTTNNAEPAISPDRKWLAFCNGDSLCLLDIDSREIVAKRATPAKLGGPRLAFSPSGKRIACVTNDGAWCWNTESGELVTEIPSNGARFGHGIGFPSEQYLFVGNSVMLDVDNQMQIWAYNGSEATQIVGEVTYMTITDGNRPGLLMNGKLPHPAALEMVAKAKTDPDLFVFKEGSSVALDLSAISDQAARDKATKAITGELTKIKCKVIPNSSLVFRAKVTGPTARQITYRSFGFGGGGGSGTYTVQEWISTLELVYDGKVVWSRGGGSNVPFTLNLKQGETMESHLRSHEKPSYYIFENPTLPKLIQKPVSGEGPFSSATLGQSRISTNGFR